MHIAMALAAGLVAGVALARFYWGAAMRFAKTFEHEFLAWCDLEHERLEEEFRKRFGG